MSKIRIRSGRRGIRNPFSGFIAGPLLSVIGVVLLFFGWKNYTATKSFLASAEHTTGTVVQIVQKTSTDSDGNQNTYYYPVVEFTTLDGEAIRYQSSTGSGSPKQHVGETVDVIYDPANPYDARINTFLDIWMLPTILLGIGAIMALAGIGAFFNAIALVAGLGGLVALLFFWKKKKDQEANSPKEGG